MSVPACADLFTQTTTDGETPGQMAGGFACQLLRSLVAGAASVDDDLVADRGFHGLDHQIGRFGPAQMAQHHLCRQNQGTRVHLVQPGILRGGAVRRFKAGVLVGDVGPRGNADPANLGGQCVALGLGAFYAEWTVGLP